MGLDCDSAQVRQFSHPINTIAIIIKYKSNNSIGWLLCLFDGWIKVDWMTKV